MQLIQEIKDFLNSDDKSIIINCEHEETKYSKEELKHGCKLLLEHRARNIKNKFSSETICPVALVDDKNNIIYIPRNNYMYDVDKILEAETNAPNEMRDFTRKFVELRQIISDKMYEETIKGLPLLDDNIIKSVNLEEYKENAINNYKNKSQIQFPITKNSIELTPEAIIDYLKDPANFKNNILDCLTDTCISRYESYVIENKCIELYLEELERNPELKKLNNICQVIEGDKQSYSIYYHTPQGKQEKTTFKKNVSNQKKLKRAVFNHQVLGDIPIELIDKITWRNEVLFDKKDYEEPKFDKKETIIRFALLGHIDKLSDIELSDEYVAYELLMTNPQNIDFIPESLTNDKNFMSKLMKNVNSEFTREEFLYDCTNEEYLWKRKSLRSKEFFFQKASARLQNDKDFLTDYINCFTEKDFNRHITAYPNSYQDIFKNGLLKYTSDYNFAKLVLEKVGVNKQVIDLIPERFIQMPDILKILKENNHTAEVYEKINSINDLKYVYEDNEIQRNICKLHPTILLNRDFVYDNITANALADTKILSLYRNDREMMDKIIEAISSKKGAKFYLDFFGWGTDINKKFELYPKNIYFASLLDSKNQELFIDGELSDIENITASKYGIVITTANCFISADINNFTLLSKDNKLQRINECDILSKEYFEEKIAEVIKEKYKLRSRKYTSVVKEVLENNKEKDIER